jgi:hypothetical protein
MTAMYLGVVLVPLLALVWNLVPRETRQRLRVPHIHAPRRFTRRLRRVWARLRRRPLPGLGLAPDVPRSPSMPGWQPAPGYSALPEPAAEPSRASAA